MSQKDKSPDICRHHKNSISCNLIAICVVQNWRASLGPVYKTATHSSLRLAFHCSEKTFVFCSVTGEEIQLAWLGFSFLGSKNPGMGHANKRTVKKNLGNHNVKEAKSHKWKHTFNLKEASNKHRMSLLLPIYSHKKMSGIPVVVTL